MEYINTIINVICLISLGFLTKVYWNLNKSNKELIENYDRMLKLYEPEKTVKTIEAIKKLKKEEIEIKINTLTKEMNKKFDQNNITEKDLTKGIVRGFLGACEGIINENIAPEDLATAVKMKLKELEESKK